MAISTIPTRAFTQQGINFRNLIMNGDMSVAQRGTSFSSTGDVYVLDRFKLDYVGSPSVRYTVSQDTDTPTGQSFAKSMKFDVTTAEVSQSETTRLWTRIESQNLQMLKYGTSNAETLSLSFWVKSNLTGTFIFWLYQEDSTRSISKSYTISSANTWEKKTITIDADTSGQINNDNGAGLRVVWFLTADQSTYGSSSLQTSWGSYNATAVATGQTNVGSSTSNEFYITGIQLEVGTSASDFEFLPHDVNLRRCMRYFQQMGNNDAMDQTATQSGTRFLQGQREGSDNAEAKCICPLLVPLRTNPTITKNDINFRQDGTNTDFNAMSVRNFGNVLEITVSNTSNFNTGESMMIRSTSADSYLRFDSEL
tara:strand:+ start:1332 stop:2432 length:1101 start_codon:yes stop_codon:yes gene_type:complete